jgi:hypothetical protein
MIYKKILFLSLFLLSCVHSNDLQKKSSEDSGKHYHFLGFYCKPVVVQVSTALCIFLLLEHRNIQLLLGGYSRPFMKTCVPFFFLSAVGTEFARRCVSGGGVKNVLCWQSAVASPIFLLAHPRYCYRKYNSDS